MSTQKINSWTPAHIAILQEHYLTQGAHYVAELTGHTYHSTREKANDIGLKRPSGLNHWSEEHLMLMREKYAELGVPGLMKLTGRSRAGVTGQARKMGLYKFAGRGTRTRSRNKNWSKRELATLQEHYPTKGPAYVAEQIGRPHSAVLAMAKRLHIRCRVTLSGRKRWPAEQLANLKQHYPTTMPMAEVCALVGGRHKNTVMHMASVLGLKRPSRIKSTPAPKAPRLPKAKPAPTPRLVAAPAAPVAKPTPAPKVKKPVLSAEEKALKKLVRQKAQAKKEKKHKPEPPKKWWQFPMGSPQYNAGMAAITAGKKPTTILDTNGRQATVWR